VMWWTASLLLGILFPPGYHSVLLVTCLTFVFLALIVRTFCKYGIRYPKYKISISTTMVMSSAALVFWMGSGLAAWDISSGKQQDKCAESGMVSRCRSNILNSIHHQDLDQRSEQLLGALLLGERKRIDRTFIEVFRYFGISHFLALSGLHLGIIALPLSLMLSLTRLNTSCRRISLLLLLYIYGAAAGFPPSLIRALAMTTSLIIRGLAGIERSLIRSLVEGSFMIAVIAFPVVLNIGFQLSFASVTAIGLIGLPLVNRLDPLIPRRPWGFILKLVLFPLIMTCSIQLFTLPIVLSLFGRVSLVCPLMNLVVIMPLTAFLYTGFLYVLIPIGWFHAFLAPLLNLLGNMIWTVPERFSHTPHPALYRGDINVAIYAAGVMFLSSALRKSCRRRIHAVTLSIILLSSAFIIGKVEKSGMRCNGFGVAHWETNDNRDRFWGESEFLSKGNGFLILGKNTDLFEANAIVRNLWNMGKGNIGTLMLTQGREGRNRGFIYILERICVKRVICSPYLFSSCRGLRKVICDLKIPSMTVSRGDRISIEGYTVEIAAPDFPPGVENPVSNKESGIIYNIR